MNDQAKPTLTLGDKPKSATPEPEPTQPAERLSHYHVDTPRYARTFRPSLNERYL